MSTLARPAAWRPMAAGLAFLIALGILPQRAPAATGGSAVVSSFYAILLGTMKHAAQLGPKGRYEELKPVVAKTFDIPFMTRLTVGPIWGSLSAGQRQQVSEAFERYVAATYADEFDGYSGERFRTLDQRPFAYGVLVQSQIIKSNGNPIAINYLMRRNGAAWQIADVYLDGTISEVATRRSDFAAILRSGGINALIAALNRKADALISSSTS